jgi:hypothetical protein
MSVYRDSVPDLDRPFCHPGVTLMHHLMIVGSSAPAGGELAGGADPEGWGQLG